MICDDRMADKSRIVELANMAPPDFLGKGAEDGDHFNLLDLDFIDLNHHDKDYWDVGVEKVIRNAGAKASGHSFVQGNSSQV